MNWYLVSFVSMLFSAAAHAEITSKYSTLDVDKDCSALDAPTADEAGQDWSRSLCNGWGGYPVHLDYGDARESAYFGFVETDEMPFATFAGFNSSGTTIEWRVEKTGDIERPIATILRWTVTVDSETNKTAEVLVVSKVGLLDKPGGCVIGLVLASSDPQANEKARKIADDKAKGFVCGKDKVETSGTVPDFTSGVFGPE